MEAHLRGTFTLFSVQSWQIRTIREPHSYGIPERAVRFLVLPYSARPNSAIYELDDLGFWSGSRLGLDLLSRLRQEGLPGSGGICTQERIVSLAVDGTLHWQDWGL